MTDRIKALTVVLEDDVREDDCEAIINAINMIRRVASVEAHVSDFDNHVAKRQLRGELGEKIIDLYKEIL